MWAVWICLGILLIGALVTLREGLVEDDAGDTFTGCLVVALSCFALWQLWHR